MPKANKSFDYNDAFPSRFRGLAEEKGCTMEEMAKTFLTTRQTVRNWQNGETIPDAKSICFIADFFGVTIDYLLGLTEIKSPDSSIRSIGDKTGLSEKAIMRLIVENHCGSRKQARLASHLILNEKTEELENVLSAIHGNIADGLHSTSYIDARDGSTYEVDTKDVLRFIANGLLWEVFGKYGEALENGSDCETEE